LPEEPPKELRGDLREEKRLPNLPKAKESRNKAQPIIEPKQDAGYTKPGALLPVSRDR